LGLRLPIPELLQALDLRLQSEVGLLQVVDVLMLRLHDSDDAVQIRLHFLLLLQFFGTQLLFRLLRFLSQAARRPCQQLERFHRFLRDKRGRFESQLVTTFTLFLFALVVLCTGQSSKV
jgi:hypothetical protein